MPGREATYCTGRNDHVYAAHQCTICWEWFCKTCVIDRRWKDRNGKPLYGGVYCPHCNKPIKGGIL